MNKNKEELQKEVLIKYPANRVLSKGKEYWGKYYVLKIMQEYSDLQNSQLLSDLKEREAIIEKLKVDAFREIQRQDKELEEKDKRIEELEKQLNEIKG